MSLGYFMSWDVLSRKAGDLLSFDPIVETLPGQMVCVVPPQGLRFHHKGPLTCAC